MQTKVSPLASDLYLEQLGTADRSGYPVRLFVIDLSDAFAKAWECEQRGISVRLIRISEGDRIEIVSDPFPAYMTDSDAQYWASMLERIKS